MSGKAGLAITCTCPGSAAATGASCACEGVFVGASGGSGFALGGNAGPASMTSTKLNGMSSASSAGGTGPSQKKRRTSLPREAPPQKGEGNRGLANEFRVV